MQASGGVAISDTVLVHSLLVLSCTNQARTRPRGLLIVTRAYLNDLNN